MAIDAYSAAPSAWHHLTALRGDLIHKLQMNQKLPERSKLEERLAAVEEQLLDTPSPDLEAIALKLRLLWSAELHAHDEASRRKLALLTDLDRLTP